MIDDVLKSTSFEKTKKKGTSMQVQRHRKKQLQKKEPKQH
jgi:hypothetical protein